MNIIIVLPIILLFLVVIYFIVYFFYAIFYFIFPMMTWGAFFARIDDESVDNIIKLAKVKPGQTAVDLGSGDGKIVIALAKAGAIACGFEINPFLVYTSRRKIKKAGFSGKAFIKQANLWKEDLSNFDIITVFGIKFIMSDLERKLKKEMKPGSLVVSKYFVFPNWEIFAKQGMVNLYKK